MTDKKNGRPTKLTPEIAKIVIDNVRSNLSLNNAARIARISPQTPFNWLTRGEEDRSRGKATVYVGFLDNIREAQGLKVRELLDKIESMPKGWQAISWLLEKCCPEEFGKDAEMYKQLLDDYKKLVDEVLKLKKVV